MGIKRPLKTIAFAVDEKEKAIKSNWGRAQSWWRPSRASVARVECRLHGKVDWKRNEEQQQNEMTTNITKTSWKFSQATTIAGSF